MRIFLLTSILTACTATSAMAQADSTKTDTTAIAKTAELGEVTVNGVRVINKVDRQLLIPTKNMVKASSNGYELLKLMMVNGIIADPVMQKISTVQGGTVQVRINDVVASQQDIMALRPDEVVRVEHIDNPGVRYSDGGLEAVINYVVKRRYAGYVGGLSTMQAFTTGFNNSSAYFKYNHKKSEFSLIYGFNYRGYDERRYDGHTTYIFPDGTERQKNYIGYNSDFMYVTNNVQLGYSLAEPDKYTLDIRLNYNHYNSPYSGMNRRVQETNQPDMFLYNNRSDKEHLPSLDIYYSLNLPHNQSIMANVVGTHINTDHNYLMRNYLFSQSPQQSMQTDPVNDYSYTTKGRKYSLISEAMYTKTMKKTALTAGVNYSVSRTENEYTGSTNNDTGMNSNNLYMFAQVQGNLSVINYQVGMGANRSSIHQGDIGFTKWTVRPQISLSTSAIKNIFIRYSGRIGQNTPSLSQLSDVRQHGNELTAYDGNTGLKPSYTYSNSILFNWSRPIFNFRLTGVWSYAPDIIMDTYIPEQQDGSYLIIGRPENQKSFTQKSVTAVLTLHAIKDILDISLYGNYNRYESRGLAYSHNYNAWTWGGSANMMLGNWSASANFYTAPKSFFGESMTGGEVNSNLNVSYRHKNLQLGIGAILLGHAQGFIYDNFTDSRYYKSSGYTQIKDNGNMVYVTLSYNFSHGRKYKADQRRLSNSDNDNGIR